MSVEGIKKYRDIDSLSASDLRTFAIDRKKFYKKNILKEKEEEEYNRATLIGSLVHCLLLEPQTFDSKYFMSICPEVPSGLMLAFVEALYKYTLENTDSNGVITADMETITKLAWQDSGFKITLEAVMKKFIGSNAETYYKELRESRSRSLEVVCSEDLQIATSIIETIRADEFVGPIFNIEENVFNEIQVEDIMFLDIKLKAMLDKVVVNHSEKYVQLYDLKVVWDNQNFYREYYLKKLAYVQALIYYTALYLRKANLGFDYSGYEIKLPIFVVVDSGNFYAPLQYQLAINDLEGALEGFEVNGRKYRGSKDIINDIKWSMESGNWRISKIAWESNGLVNLK